MGSEHFQLFLHCPYCHGAISLYVEDWSQDGDAHPQRWNCPYYRKETGTTMPGRVVRATAQFVESKVRH